MNARARTALVVLSAAAVLAGTAQIAAHSAGYFTDPFRHPFLLERPELAQDSVWRAALVMHVAGGLLCLATGPVLVWNLALRRSPALHRWLGRAYVVAILGWAGPSGLWLGAHAKGGLPAQSGFFALGVLSIATTVLGWRTIRRGDRAAHARWMARSYALALSALHFRAIHVAQYALGWTDDAAYAAGIWLSLATSVAQGEWLCAQLARFGRIRTLLLGGSIVEGTRPAPRSVVAAVRGLPAGGALGRSGRAGPRDHGDGSRLGAPTAVADVTVL